MSVNVSTLVKLPCQDMFSVPVTFTPIVSQPAMSPYAARGIFITGPVDVLMTDGSVFSDQRTILDIRAAEYPVVPTQGDRVTVPFDQNGAPVGEFEITDTSDDGGLITCTLRKYEAPLP